MSFSTYFYDPRRIPQYFLEHCDNFKKYYENTYHFDIEENTTSKIKKYVILIFLYIPYKVLTVLSDRIAEWIETPSPYGKSKLVDEPLSKEEHEKTRVEYRQLFDFGSIENPDQQIDKLIAKKLPPLPYSQIYIFYILANRSNRHFAHDGQRAMDLPKLLSYRDRNERILFCALNNASMTAKEYWTGTLNGWNEEELKRTIPWLRDKCQFIFDEHSLDSLYDKLKDIEAHKQSLALTPGELTS